MCVCVCVMIAAVGDIQVIAVSRKSCQLISLPLLSRPAASFIPFLARPHFSHHTTLDLRDASTTDDDTSSNE